MFTFACSLSNAHLGHFHHKALRQARACSYHYIQFHASDQCVCLCVLCSSEDFSSRTLCVQEEITQVRGTKRLSTSCRLGRLRLHDLGHFHPHAVTPEGWAPQQARACSYYSGPDSRTSPRPARWTSHFRMGSLHANLCSKTPGSCA